MIKTRWTAAGLAAMTAVALLAGCGKPPEKAAETSQDGFTLADFDKALAKRKVSCPAKATPRAAGAPVDDILGLRIGMSAAAAEQMLLCASKQYFIEYAGSSEASRRGLEARVELHAIRAAFDAPPSSLSKEEVAAIVKGKTVGPFGLRESRDWPTFTRSQEHVSALLVGPVGREQVLGLKREQNFEEGAQPPMTDTVAALKAKYGPPSFEGPDEYRNINLYWVYDPAGRLVPASALAASELADCASINSNPTGGWEWQPKCGLTVTAFVRNAQNNESLVEAIYVGVIDQVTASRSFEAFVAQLDAQQAQKQQREVEKARDTAPATKF